ncbi:hypothetical protein ES705_50638 [subsurface metagenome]
MAGNCGQTHRKGSKVEVRKENYKKNQIMIENYEIISILTSLDYSRIEFAAEVKLFRKR